jgi:hypothetical protein
MASDTAPDIDGRIDEYFEQMRDLMFAMDYVFSECANQHHQSTDEKCLLFEKACKYIGGLWRVFLKISVAPKLHMLESHVWVQMQFFRNLVGEDPVERWHNKDNQANRLLNNIKTFFRAELVKANRRSTSINREWM